MTAYPDLPTYTPAFTAVRPAAVTISKHEAHRTKEQERMLAARQAMLAKHSQEEIQAWNNRPHVYKMWNIDEYTDMVK